MPIYEINFRRKNQTGSVTLYFPIRVVGFVSFLYRKYTRKIVLDLKWPQKKKKNGVSSYVPRERNRRQQTVLRVFNTVFIETYN